MILQCQDCFSRNIEYLDATTEEYLPDWLVDARSYLLNWNRQEEPGLLKWQDEKNYSDEFMQIAVDGIMNSDKQSGPRPKGYPHPHRAIKTWVNNGYGRSKEQGQQQSNGRYSEYEKGMRR